MHLGCYLHVQTAHTLENISAKLNKNPIENGDNLNGEIQKNWW